MSTSRKLREKDEARLARERGTIYQDPGGRVSVCLVYPSTYHVGMSSLGFQGVYTMINDREDAVCERSFLPDDEDMDEYARTGAELCALESGRPLGDFDIIAFSVSFENDYPNVLRILELARIPLLAQERSGHHPLVIMGGVCAFSNPEPLAPFFDAVLVGEAEGLLDEFLDGFGGAPSREEFLRSAPAVEGVYVPSLYDVTYAEGGTILSRNALHGAPQTIKRRYTSDLATSPVRASIVTPDTEFANMTLVEAMRGCPWSCGFCLAGHVFNPPRKKPLDAVLKEVEKARSADTRVGLIGPSMSDYPYALEVLSTEGVDFSITSLRASRKSADLVSHMAGHRSVSIAPEAGTERLRQVINKRVTEEDILETAGLLFEHGVERLRLYFMVGLPTEADEDSEGIVELVRKVRGLSARGLISLTLSTFVPKPFTPFQWETMTPMKTVKQRMKLIKQGLKAEKGVSVFNDVPKYAYLQGMFAMGDRRVAGVLVKILKEPDWRRAAGEAGVDPDFYMMRQKSFGEPLPWDFIEAGITKEDLLKRHPHR